MALGVALRLRAVERSEATVVASKLVSFAVGPLTVLAVGAFLSPATQGYYYSFTSVVAASMFFEAGISTAVVQIAAHEAGRLQVRLSGVEESGSSLALQRLSGVFRFAVGWYGAIAGVMLLCITSAGIILFSSRPAGISWLIPWLILVVFASVDLFLQCFFVLLQGTGQVVHVYRYQILRTVVQNTVLITGVALGWGLLALPLGTAAGVVLAAANILPARRFFLQLWRTRAHRSISWRTEIFPFQWRIALSWGAGYLSSALFTPLLLATRGPAEAGQMGMTMMLTSACTALAASVMLAQAPSLGGLAGRGEWNGLIALFRRKAVCSVTAAALLLTIACVVVWGAQLLRLPLADRVLPWSTFAPLAFGILVYHTEGVLAFFMRAQKREPYFVLEIVGAALILPAALAVSPSFGAIGLVVVFATVHAVVLLPVAVAILGRSLRRVRSRAMAPSGRPLPVAVEAR